MIGEYKDTMFPGMWFVILLSWTSQVNGQSATGCPNDAQPVVDMCTGQSATGSRVFLDTSNVEQQLLNCSCYLQTTAYNLGISMFVAPNFQGCLSRLEFHASSPFTFECLYAGFNANVQNSQQFDVIFRKSTPTGSNNYCVEIKALPIGTAATTVTLDCRPIYTTTTTQSTTTSSTSTTTTTTTTPSTSTSTSTTTTTTTTATTSFSTSTISDAANTTEKSSTVTSPTSTVTTTTIVMDTGFPSGVSKTAIIIIGVIVGAGLIVGILIAVLAICGKRKKMRHDKARFAIPQNNNQANPDIPAENGTHGGRPGTGHENKEFILGPKTYPDHSANANYEFKQTTNFPAKFYQNPGYNPTKYSNEMFVGENTVVSERL